ncbi:putative immunogenic protein NIP-2 [Ditylenchus destructor]|uniref:Immunogenic protein NIP-2 n=1 Tax=Ditylenchus destructor TaxID=166010 RepID=A0AAD4NKC4_9BILA|nr:putative immunogenic protein NIP-2 [Ditylenchus destructor]
MPWSKFRPLRQFGKHNVRIFKEMLKARNKRNLDFARFHPDVMASIKQQGIQIQDSRDPNFFEQFEDKILQEPLLDKAAHPLKKTSDHPLNKKEKCLLFDGTVPMTDGVDQACVLIKATKAQPFPPNFFDTIPDDFLPDNFEAQVVDSIMHGERYDATLEKLPKRFDPIIFWVPHPAFYGTPVTKRCNIIISDLWRKIAMLSMKRDKSTCSDLRFDCNAPISGFLPESNSGLGHSFVLRQQPYLTIQGSKPLTPFADVKSVEATKEMDVPDIYPISAVIDLEPENIYNDTSLVPRQFVTSLNIHTICTSRMQDQKYPLTTEQNAANCILNGFGAALAQISRNGFEDFLTSEMLSQPLLLKSMQIVNGKIDFAMVQINNFSDDINILAAPLYTPKPFYENMNEVTDLNMDTVKKFVAFMLYR